ncbi:MAG: glycerophosphodiester phosphodiesterase family protein [Sediminicola sp.]
MKKISLKPLMFLLVLSLQVALGQFNKNVVIAHRGAWKQQNLPENSIASLKEAIRLGCHASEFDVHLTKDNVMVVNHDPHFKDMEIATSTYGELLAKQLDNGENIPTVEAYILEGMRQKGTKLILEIKSSSLGKDRTLELTKRAVAMVKKLKAQKWVEYICFDYDAGKLVHKLDRKAKVAYLNGDIAPEQVKKDGYTGLDYKYTVYEKHPKWIAEAHKIGLSVNAWTVNGAEPMKNLLLQDVEYITTNEPELLFKVIEESAK